jgi:hypothetical protein
MLTRKESSGLATGVVGRRRSPAASIHRLLEAAEILDRVLHFLELLPNILALCALKERVAGRCLEQDVVDRLADGSMSVMKTINGLRSLGGAGRPPSLIASFDDPERGPCDHTGAPAVLGGVSSPNANVSKDLRISHQQPDRIFVAPPAAEKDGRHGAHHNKWGCRGGRGRARESDVQPQQ